MSTRKKWLLIFKIELISKAEPFSKCYSTQPKDFNAEFLLSPQGLHRIDPLDDTGIESSII